MHADDQIDLGGATRDDIGAPPRRRSGLVWTGVAIAVVVIAAVVGASVWRARTGPAVAPPVAASSPQPETVASPPAPAVQHIIEAPPNLAPLQAGEVGGALTGLLGSKPVLSFLQVDGFPRRLVATVDNLGRSHAPQMAWPVNPMPGKFSVDQRG